ncbi:MAG: hypothetical protein EAX96_17260 [Candidatus Lokiarchaeota archaeon]|nr:hypothetical protein [Candidatus Lokiarchaeota archaeon]
MELIRIENNIIRNNNFFEREEDSASINIFGQRAIIMFAGTFQTLAKSIENVIGQRQAEGVLYDAGINSGRCSAKILLKSWEERGNDFLQKWAKFYESSGVGWFKVKNIEVDLDTGEGTVRIENPFVIKKYGISACFQDLLEYNDKELFCKTCCHFLSGFIVGMLKELTNKKLECDEIVYGTEEDLFCEFKIKPY